MMATATENQGSTLPEQAGATAEAATSGMPTVWVEKTLVQDRPDRQEGPDRLGVALWSPQRSTDGRDFYANMREVRVGDLVLHLTDNEAITGFSVVAEPLDTGFGRVPGTKWAAGPCYRIALRDFRQLEPSLRREWFFADPEIGERLRALSTQPHGRGLFFNGKLELNQGAYLTEAPPPLVAALDAAYVRHAGEHKRSPEWAVKLAYAEKAEERFYVPSNVFILGMMNTADRSLAVVDYALRRRFAFATLLPAFGESAFRAYLLASGVVDELADRMIDRMTELNAAIAADTTNLGRGYCIGHSFFTPTGDGEHGAEWYRKVVETEIVPLLEEYWFDQPDKVMQWRARLLA
jgi:hypothetical protein